MRKLIIYLIIISLPLNLTGQLSRFSGHNHFTSLTINPAIAGSDNALSAAINYRNQWTGFKEAPKNSILTIHSPVKNNRIALGFHIDDRSHGIYNTTNYVGNYAYRTEVKNGIFSMGLGFGAAVYSIKWNNLNAADLNDELLQNNTSSAVMPVFSLGLYYYSEKYYAGFSLPNFLSHALSESSGSYKSKNDRTNYTYILQGGYDMEITSRILLRPSLLVKYNPKDATQIDLNTFLGYEEKMWIGLGYRNSNTYAGMLQFQLNYQIRMAYTYDFNTGELGKYINGSHEIGLNYIFRYSRRVIGPRHF